MARFSIMGISYDSPTQQLGRTSTSPDPHIVEHQMVTGMSALQSHDGDSKRGYLPSPWSGCLGAQPGSDDFDHYALDSSPAMSSITYHDSSSQSSPRSWDSPDQLGPTPWEAATEEQVHGRYHGLDPQLSGAAYLPGSHSGEMPTSCPVDAASFVPAQSFHGSDDGSQDARSQTGPYPAGYHASPADVYPLTPESSAPLSACTTLVDVPSPRGNAGINQPLGVESASRNTRKEPPLSGSAGADGEKKEEAYAQLIYRAFMSTPERAMTLQDIYQWFRDNTEKGKDDSKGWQNSIRHNLSMNGAFTKRDRRPDNAKDGDTDNKKSTEWFLEPWAVEGVQSTTRYRGKGNQRRSATSQSGISARVYRGYPTHHHHHHHSHSHSHSATASRRGPSVAANGLLAGRLLRATSRQGGTVAAALRSNTAAMNLTAAAANHALPPYHFPSPASARAATAATFLYPSTAATTQTSYYHPHHQQQQQQQQPHTPGEMDYHHHQPHHHTSPYEYDYPSPHLYPQPGPHPASSSSAAAMSRAASEPGPAPSSSGVGVDEPMTPEPLYPDASAYPLQQGMEININMDVDMGMGMLHHHHQQEHQQNQQHVGAYEEVVDRYQGWAGAHGGGSGQVGAGVEVCLDEHGLGQRHGEGVREGNAAGFAISGY